MEQKYRITLTEEMLGTKPINPQIFTDYIAGKIKDATLTKDEIKVAEAQEQDEQAGTTIIHMVDVNGAATPILWDYMFKGFFKDACKSLRNADETLSSKLTAFATKIDGLIFVNPRYIPIVMPPGAKKGVCERPLRVNGAMGERVCLARSETVPAGSYMDISIRWLSTEWGKGDAKVNVGALIEEWLSYGELRGMGAWRNSGKGRFTCQKI
jgi:hypothetical protein